LLRRLRKKVARLSQGFLAFLTEEGRPEIPTTQSIDDFTDKENKNIVTVENENANALNQEAVDSLQYECHIHQKGGEEESICKGQVASQAKSI
jgi:hypothetical protein